MSTERDRAHTVFAAAGGGAASGSDVPMTARARMALWLVIASNLVFASTDLRLSADLLRPVLALKVVQVAAAAGGLVVLRAVRRERWIKLLLFVVAFVVAHMFAISGALTNDMTTAMILCVVAAFGGATILRWGPLAQGVLVLILASAMVTNVYLSHGNLVALTGYTSVGFQLALGISLLLAYEFERQRVLLVRENQLRAAAEREVLRSERQLREIFDSMQDVLYRVDLAGRIQLVSPSVRRYGYEPEELIGRDAATLYLDPGQRQANVDLLLAQGALRDREVLLRAKDGREVPMSAHVHVVRDDHGEVVAFEGTLRDSTERVEAERALRHARDGLDETVRRRTADLEKLQRHTAALLDVARDASGTIELREILHRVERRTAQVMPCEMVATFYWNDDPPAYYCTSQFGVPVSLQEGLRSLQARAPEPYGARLAAGESVVLEDLSPLGLAEDVLEELGAAAMLAVPLQAHGRHLGALVVVRDRTRPFEAGQIALAEAIASQLAMALEVAELYRAQREQAEVSGALARVGEELIASLDRPELLERTCRLTVELLGCDACHTILNVPEENRCDVVAHQGYSDEAVLRIRALPLDPEVFRASAVALRRSGAVQRRTADLCERERATTEGVGIRSFLAMPLLRGRELVGMHVATYLHAEQSFTRAQERIGRGISQIASLALGNARALEAMREASRLKSEFVATMSHELRTPLNVVLGYNELLLDGDFGPLTAEQTDILRRSDQSARSLLALISDTLDLGRLEAGRIALECAPVALVELVSEVEKEMREVASKPGVRFEAVLAANLPLVHTDPLKLKVILKHLIDNAFKFTERGAVQVTAGVAAEEIEIRVEDTGVGIPKEVLDHIFEPFRQGDGSDSRRFGGVGLGLYLADRLIGLLGGTIAVDSQVGVGTCFSVRLPLRPKETLAA